MKFALSQVAIIAVGLLAACMSQPEPIEADLVVEHVNIIPMTEEIILGDKTIAVRDGEIVAILDQHSARRINAKTRIDGEGRYLMPGLADMHIHMRMPSQGLFNLLLANGVTTAANMRLADGGYDHVQLREDIAAGRMTGPRYLVSGPMLTYENLPDEASVGKYLDRHVAEGYDFIKIHDDLSKDVFNALIEEAEERGVRVRGHAQRLQPLAQSLRMDAIEHVEEFLYVTFDGLDAQPDDFDTNKDVLIEAYLENLERLGDPVYRRKVANRIAASGTYVDTTLIIFDYIGLYLNDQRFGKLKDDPYLSYIPQSVRDQYLDPERNEYRANMFNYFAPLVGLETHGEVAEHFEQNFELLLLMTHDLYEAGVPLQMLLGQWFRDMLYIKN